MPIKKILRVQYKTARDKLTALEIDARSRKIHDLLFSRIMMHRFSSIHTFFPIKKNNEVDTHLIVETLQRDFAPDIYISKSYPNGSLTHHIYTPQTRLVVTKWGVPEPADVSSPVPEETLDLVLIPLLAFDKKGYRVGYGGGFYDRFLSKCTPECLKIGLSFFEPVNEIPDVSEFDIKLNHCVTPDKIWTFGTAG